MSVSIYCSPTHLKLIVGSAGNKSIDISNFTEVPLPDGAMINGIITNEEIMSNFLKDIGSRMDLFSQDVSLVIDNNSIRSKVMNVPPVKESAIIEFIKREIGALAGEEEDDVCDYAVLNPAADANGAKILAVSVNKDLLTVYKNVVEGAGFKLKSIDIGVNAIIKISKVSPQLNGTCILAIIDEKTLMLTLFEKGEFSVTNKYRIMNTENTPEWHNEIGGHISSVLQFHKGQRSDTEVSAVYFAGIDSAQGAGFSSALTYLGINIELLNLSDIVKINDNAKSGETPINPGSFLLNIGALLKK